MADALRCRLYLITPPVLGAGFEDMLAAALDGGDVAAVQLRLKGVSDGELVGWVERLRPVAQSRGVAFLLNDRPDLAVTFGCDGAHVGQEDMAVAQARGVVGDLMLGVTCHGSRHLAIDGAEAGADYVAFGAFYPSATKAAPVLADVEVLRWWAEVMEVPCVAIGGINAGNCAPLVQAGADFLAVAGAVWDYPDGARAGVAAMLRAMAAASPA